MYELLVLDFQIIALLILNQRDKIYFMKIVQRCFEKTPHDLICKKNVMKWDSVLKMKLYFSIVVGQAQVALHKEQENE